MRATEAEEESCRLLILDEWRGAVQGLRDQRQRELQQLQVRKAAAQLESHTKELQALARVLNRSYYEALEVAPTATEADIGKALKTKWLRCHPDKVPEELHTLANSLAKRLGEVREVLMDPIKRQRYDWSLNTNDATYPTAFPSCFSSHASSSSFSASRSSSFDPFRPRDSTVPSGI